MDPEARLAELWLPGDERPRVLTVSISWHPGGREAPLVLDLPALFREAFAEAP